MSARTTLRTSTPAEFRLEALESRSLLSAAPTPDPADATLLNGQHPVADASFLEPNEDWTVAQPGHDSGPRPTFTDEDMYDFGDDDSSWDQWDQMDDADYGDSDDGDFSEVTGLPAQASQHLNDGPPPLMNAPQPPAAPSADEPGAPIDEIPDPTPASTIPPVDSKPHNDFVDFDVNGEADPEPSASLFVFGKKTTKGVFAPGTDKPSINSSFVDGSDHPFSGDLKLPSID